MKTKLKYLGADILSSLHKNIKTNLDLYKNGNFLDLSQNVGWEMELESVTVDTSQLGKLEMASGTDAEIRNSLIIFNAFDGMTPNLAREERIWTRLSHVECFEYSRERWVSGAKDDAELSKKIEIHFFAKSSTRIRDDHAISRLWWNAHIAHICFPQDPEKALNMILGKADIRSNFIERSRVTSRINLAGGIIRAMTQEPWVTKHENNYRSFMKSVNNYGGGKLFEIMSDEKVDLFINQSTEVAKSEMNA